jgi:hypothetical protein
MAAMGNVPMTEPDVVTFSAGVASHCPSTESVSDWLADIVSMNAGKALSNIQSRRNRKVLIDVLRRLMFISGAQREEHLL